MNFSHIQCFNFLHIALSYVRRLYNNDLLQTINNSVQLCLGLIFVSMKKLY